MLFFQLALLLGYGLSAWLLKRPIPVQVAITTGLCVLAIVSTRLPWIQESRFTEVSGILLTLTLGMLPAMVLLFSTSLLMHGWLHRRGKPVPIPPVLDFQCGRPRGSAPLSVHGGAIDWFG